MTCYTATITARPSAYIDAAGSVDAEVFADGVRVGEATLQPNPDRNGGLPLLDIFGTPEHWGDSELISHVAGYYPDDDATGAAIEAIVQAVREADYLDSL